jgi:hypothetical protein
MCRTRTSRLGSGTESNRTIGWRFPRRRACTLPFDNVWLDVMVIDERPGMCLGIPRRKSRKRRHTTNSRFRKRRKYTRRADSGWSSVKAADSERIDTVGMWSNLRERKDVGYDYVVCRIRGMRLQSCSKRRRGYWGKVSWGLSKRKDFGRVL